MRRNRKRGSAWTIVGLSALLLLSGCGGANSPNGPIQTNNPSNSNTSYEVSNEDSGIEQAAYTIDDYDAAVANAQLAFAFDLYDEVRKADTDAGSNDFLSPASIATALAMTLNGAGGDTLNAMNQVLHLEGMDAEERNRGYQVLLDLLSHSGEEIKLSVANSLWARDDLSFNKQFIQTNKDYFNAEMESLDFQDAQSADKINKWVREQTAGKINEIIKAPIKENAILFLLNTIYFKANWASSFSEDLTETRPFTNADGSQQDVPMMLKDGKLSHLSGEGFQAVRIPYNGGSMSMIVFLPDKDKSLDAFLDGLSAAQWKKLLGQFKPAIGQLRLPRFKMEYEITLNDALKALGMETAFDPNRADFSPMISHDNNVYIGEVKHKTFIEVNEQGTEAGAVTSIGMEVTSAPSNTFEMEVDRPFFFAIHDERTNSILFMGTVRQLD
ncbi:hypothetical protein PAT3040_06047 [Paenibacillus agaridevorans]|uniref:Serpin domain-containing protein n=1 Tax=Paenibacillus agaridevorans TaxID=171404 RepID=A0A2R5F3Z4_9BACL|nr:serpin family protein [Paenibacillus agaridevorans]GBG11253.1 hypothetical protein PAT3040_06047 [Paenibacillus agaridevorans]